jgi:hypothetical protein
MLGLSSAQGNNMSLRMSVGLAVVLLPALITAALGETDPLSDRLTSATGSLCFSRDYDAAHLRQHKGQLTQAAMLSFKSDAVRVMLRQKGRAAPVYLVATCEWNPRTAGITTSGTRMMPSFKKRQGYDCIVIVSPGSAQEGGYAVIDPSADAKSVTLHFDSPVQARPSLDKDARVLSLNLGREDRAFLLTRVEPAACRAMEQALEGL